MKARLAYVMTTATTLAITASVTVPFPCPIRGYLPFH